MFSRRLSLTLEVSALALAANAYAKDKYPVTVETNVAMKTRDGVTLDADIYRPDAEGKFPVILERTPYDKRISRSVRSCLRFAAEGYVCIRQDVRGRFTSEGGWYPWKYESQDGYDAVEWAAALPYSNGKVGMFGGSYLGATQLLAAIAAPPHLVGIMPALAPSDFYAHWAYQGGAFAQLKIEAWTTRTTIDTLDRRMRKLQPWRDLKRPPGEYPLLELGTPAGLADWYFDYLKHPAYDDYWKQVSVHEHFDQIRIPALHIGGWYDPFLDGTLRSYTGIKSKGGSESARKGQRLVIFAGGHAGAGPRIGDFDFGKDSVLDTFARTLHWYDYLLKGIDNGMASQKPVRVFVMGKNVWRDEDDWPLARAKVTRFYLHSRGKANTLNGDGTLSTTRPATEPADRYVYDPEDPTPTHGGPVLNDRVHFPPGPLDQRAVESRSDVLVYTAPALQKDTEVTGPVSLELYVSSSAVDTDFTGKLVDVWPNGFGQNLTEGILRARYRTSMQKAELMNPGQIYKLTIELSSTSNVFLTGHKLQVEVASSSFPRFDRNLNTGGSPESATTQIKATNVVYHDRDHASALIVPVIP